MRFIADIVAVALIVAASPASAADDHSADIGLFARISADVRTAAEVCSGLSPDWTVINIEKARLHITDVDYMTFEKMAHDRAVALEQRFKADHGAKAWCAEAAGLYGPQGSALADALRR